MVEERRSEALRRALKVLIIGYVWPEPESSAAGFRTASLIETFLGSGFDVVFSSPSKESHFSQRLSQSGISAHAFPPNDPRFDEFIKGVNPDYVIFDRFVTEEQFGWRVEEHCPDAVRVVDTQDLHFLRRGRQKALNEGKSLSEVGEAQFDLLTEDALRELASLLRSDCSLVLSSFEMDLLTRRFGIPERLLYYSPFHYSDKLGQGMSFAERQHFVMIGNFRHPPNSDAIRWFSQEIWPMVRGKLPEVEVHIYGAYPPKEMMALTDPRTGLFVKGATPDQFETLRKYRVNLAPLRFGAGIKGKIGDGWLCGTPVVTTPIGSEGMSGDLPWGGENAHTAAEFAEKMLVLYQDQSSWELAQARGFHILREIHSAEKNSVRLVDHLLRIRDDLKSLRKENVMGSILRHSLYRSTKYFSKWIELKNNKKEEKPESSPPDLSS